MVADHCTTIRHALAVDGNLRQPSEGATASGERRCGGAGWTARRAGWRLLSCRGTGALCGGRYVWACSGQGQDGFGKIAAAHAHVRRQVSAAGQLPLHRAAPSQNKAVPTAGDWPECPQILSIPPALRSTEPPQCIPVKGPDGHRLHRLQRLRHG